MTCRHILRGGPSLQQNLFFPCRHRDRSYGVRAVIDEQGFAHLVEDEAADAVQNCAPLTNCRGSPPSAEISQMEIPWLELKKIESLGPQTAPLGLGASANVTGSPPRSETFLSAPPAKKPTD